ncbi:hypothetical protein [Candidatus Ichthyocystis sparus]|uniref:hypothetical protein n=1 Tax=Candidatus Ichthyocystis sparus TaxID=1561004 RepID=UPI000AF43F61|nr:hypothetical protein [Candidatus Ichthyocystis sparus]
MKRRLSSSSSGPSSPKDSIEQGSVGEYESSSELEQSSEVGFILEPHLAQILGMGPGESLVRGMFFGSERTGDVLCLINQILEVHEDMVHGESEEGASGGYDPCLAESNQLLLEALMSSIEGPAEVEDNVDIQSGGLSSSNASKHGEEERAEGFVPDPSLAQILGMNPGELLVRGMFFGTEKASFVSNLVDQILDNMIRRELGEGTSSARLETAGDLENAVALEVSNSLLVQALMDSIEAPGAIAPKQKSVIVIEDSEESGESSVVVIGDSEGSGESSVLVVGDSEESEGSVVIIEEDVEQARARRIAKHEARMKRQAREREEEKKKKEEEKKATIEAKAEARMRSIEREHAERLEKAREREEEKKKKEEEKKATIEAKAEARMRSIEREHAERLEKARRKKEALEETRRIFGEHSKTTEKVVESAVDVGIKEVLEEIVEEVVSSESAVVVREVDEEMRETLEGVIVEAVELMVREEVVEEVMEEVVAVVAAEKTTTDSQ